MNITKYSEHGKLLRPTRPMALLLTAILSLSVFTGCGGSKTSAPPPPVDDTRGGTVANPGAGGAPQAKQGLSNKQKVAITLALSLIHI